MSLSECTDTTCLVEAGYFSYEPSPTGNGILLGCFILLIPFTTFFGLRYRSPTHSILLMVGLVFEAMCYTGRLLARGKPRDTSYFALYLVGSSLGPTFITTAIFHLLPRVMTIYDKDLIDLRPKHLNYLFFAISLLTLTLQAFGSVYAAVGSTDIEIDQGFRILMVGFAIHLASLILFFLIYLWFLQKKHRRAGRLNPENAYVYDSSRFRLFVFGWQLAAWFLLVRTIYRLVESIEGLDSSLAQTEAAFMVLDGTQMVITAIILTALHPGKAFGKTWCEKTDQDHHEHRHQEHGPDSGDIFDDINDTNDTRSYTPPRRAPAPTQLPLVHSNKYPHRQEHCSWPLQTSPTRTANQQDGGEALTPGFSPTGYKDSPKLSPSSWGAPTAVNSSASAPPTATGKSKYPTCFSIRSSRTYRSGSTKSPTQAHIPAGHTSMVSSEDLW